jgi:hypothetical protein
VVSSGLVKAGSLKSSTDPLDVGRDLSKLITRVGSSAVDTAAAFKHISTAMSGLKMHTTPDYTRAASTASTSFVLTKDRSYWVQASCALAFEEYPQFLGVKLHRAREGVVPENSHDGKRRGGTTKWNAGWGADYDSLNEIIHLAQFRRKDYGVHGAYVNAVEIMVSHWGEKDHRELASHMAQVTGRADPEEEKRREFEAVQRKRTADLANAALERDRLAAEARERAAREEAEARARAEREQAERELLEAVAFEEKVAAGGGGW